MEKSKYTTLLYIWIVILLIELAWVYGLLHQVHDQEEFIFRLAVVVVTLVVGMVSVICSALVSTRRNH